MNRLNRQPGNNKRGGALRLHTDACAVCRSKIQTVVHRQLYNTSVVVSPPPLPEPSVSAQYTMAQGLCG
jgi:hypothetical protein